MTEKPQDYILAYLKYAKKRNEGITFHNLSGWLVVKLNIRKETADIHIKSAIFSGLITTDRWYLYLSKEGERLSKFMEIKGRDRWEE